MPWRRIPRATWFIAQDSKLLLKMTMTIDHVMGQVPVEVQMSDYREVEGIEMPFRTMNTVMFQQMLLIVDSVEHDVELPPEAFAPPDEVKALLEKQAAPKLEATGQATEEGAVSPK